MLRVFMTVVGASVWAAGCCAVAGRMPPAATAVSVITAAAPTFHARFLTAMVLSVLRVRGFGFDIDPSSSSVVRRPALLARCQQSDQDDSRELEWPGCLHFRFPFGAICPFTPSASNLALVV